VEVGDVREILTFSILPIESGNFQLKTVGQRIMIMVHPTEAYFYLQKMVNPENEFVQSQDIETCLDSGLRVRGPFLSDWWEAFVISGCYAMGDPLASRSEGTGRKGRRQASPVRNSLK